MRPRTLGLLLFLLGSALFVWVGTSWERTSAVAMTDFNAVYCGARSLIEHRDPYNPTQLERVYLTDTAGHSSDRFQIRRAVSIYIYPPTAFVLTVPFALLPWGSAHIIWMVATAASFILAAFLMWEIGSTRAPVISGLLICLVPSNQRTAAGGRQCGGNCDQPLRDRGMVLSARKVRAGRHPMYRYQSPGQAS